MHIHVPQKQTLFNHILDPDCTYHSTSIEDRMYDYFKNLKIVENPQHIVGIYIQYFIKDVAFEKYPLFYSKIAPHIEKKIIKYFDFGNANLFNDHTNIFFITMFDVTEEQVQFAFLQLYQEVTAKKLNYHHKEYTFDIHCGVYISYPYISPHHFFILSQEQLQNTLQHQNSFFSIKTLPYPNVVHNIDKSDELTF